MDILDYGKDKLVDSLKLLIFQNMVN